MKFCCPAKSALDLLGLRSIARLKDMPAVRLGLFMPAIGLCATVRLERRLRSLGREGDTCVLICIFGGAWSPNAEDEVDMDECEPEGVTGVGIVDGWGETLRGKVV